MSWSLQIRNGDLFHHDGHYATVQGPVKLVQDIRHAILERFGTDEFHPEHGSVIDGGVRSDGTEVPSLIGMTDVNLVTLNIESEIRRIEYNIQARQKERLENDNYVYGRTTLRKDEVLASISNIRFEQVGDSLFVTLTVKPLSGRPEILTLPIVTG
jgi:hypothetical protein